MAGHADPIFFLSRNPVVSARCCVCARHMYLRDNIWGSHRRDQVRKKCFHFTEGHSSRKLFIFLSAKQVCRRRKWLRCQSRHGHLNCRQHLKIKIWPARHEHLARHVTCMPKQRCRRHSARKLVQTFWMASPEPSNPPVVWTPLVGSCRSFRQQIHPQLVQPRRTGRGHSKQNKQREPTRKAISKYHRKCLEESLHVFLTSIHNLISNVAHIDQNHRQLNPILP